MKYFFIINPAAGQGKAAGMKQLISETAEEEGIDFGIYTTKAVGDAKEFAKIASEGPETKTIFACGGDGTLNEVVNGVMEAHADDVSVGCIPCGTGNDFVRNFSEAGDFTDIKAQIEGARDKCDLIFYEIEEISDDGYGRKTVRGYAINMFNIGFDANVVDLAGSMKKMPLISGPLAYFTSAGVMLIKKKGADLKVESEEDMLYDGPLLLAAVTNGCYCGGGFKGIPYARTDDGLMDVSLVRDTNRRTFLKLVAKYKDGTHLEAKAAKGLVIYKKTKSLTITPNGGRMRVCVDGEMMTAGAASFRIVPQAVSFVLPRA